MAEPVNQAIDRAKQVHVLVDAGYTDAKTQLAVKVTKMLAAQAMTDELTTEDCLSGAL